MIAKTLLAATMALAMTLSAHAEDVLAKVKSAGVLKVGTETAFAPFDFIDAGEHAGLNVDLFAEIGKELGVKIEWITLPWDGVLPGLESGKFDVVAGPATITKARMERYRFSAPVAEATVALLKPAADTSLTKPEDIAGKAVGSGKATAQLAQLQAFGKSLPSAPEVKEYVSFNEAYADLAAGRIVAVANSFPNIAYVAKQRPETFALVEPPFGAKTYFGFPGRKDPEYASLMDAIDAAIIKMKGDGRMAEMQKKWFGVAFDTPEKVTEPAI
ncbi:transporter substrate-binding domain-containing protein [Aurantimonas sp. Leaf443]|uniref:transporter substrate-binding domain-containing protein n=1 Tax=Aurantimonas sp. Leaf443 TaxID=1736378 RepID=UPI00070035EA|nr:transporter substrate-binding domain-containing protein [Aurantimonas sp. Leaf443]KQT85155.1 amino acid ABC transporter [Aurantimonas sp. Leaf443]